ncbi:YegS/Rv2252/BmrU family lipid kinase [Blastopirellula sp. JC732]|uniref:YegS/Rv2252/BmrU family lipid kinase n=1 Tax=Blastopirellula sediminis TaxID=2894196 RepID=A0A9X1SHJ2_9BACT|nr:YegS/Rv2252/BmrU family lipid kinase [Blastopirellula sediminis]MCC9605445.1 YegS/Rv2252/BmrU family lipid kinase [Blastopirellula sediminis]MCC9631255.1 YegS/Rv2252/BmrU family lipid kinase [Blastopirellula sediminis]
MRRYVVIWNRNARQGAAAAEAKAELIALAGDSFHETESFEDACRCLEHVADEDLVIVAGGDGGISGIIHHLHSGETRPTLAVVPLGTGNDFVRSLGYPPDPLAAIDAIRAGQTADVDVIQLDHDGESRWFINVAAGGNQRKVEERVSDEVKQFWGPFAYARCSLEALPEIEKYQLQMWLDDADPFSIDLWTLTIANGRTVGGGVEVAPRAKVDDGLLEVTGLQGESLIELGSIAASFLQGAYLEHPSVFHRQASKIRLRSEQEFEFSVDGEMVVGHEFTFTTLPQAQKIIVGPDFA